MTTTLGKDRTGAGELPDLLRHLDIDPRHPSLRRMVGRGDGSRSERLALLEAHRGRVRQPMAEMQSALDVIDFKITMYAGGLAP